MYAINKYIVDQFTVLFRETNVAKSSTDTSLDVPWMASWLMEGTPSPPTHGPMLCTILYCSGKCQRDSARAGDPNKARQALKKTTCSIADADGHGIPQPLNMRPSLVCRSLLGMLVLMQAFRVEGQDVNQGGRDDDILACKCSTKRDCKQVGEGQTEGEACVQGKYCDDWGFHFSSKTDKNPTCRECNKGYYYSEESLRYFSDIRGPDKITIRKFVDPDCEAHWEALCLIKTEKDTAKGLDFFQTCSHCPIHTIVNSQYAANSGPRCFYSCYDAYKKMYENEILQNADKEFKAPELPAVLT